MSPTCSLQSPFLSKIIAQLAVASLFEITLDLVASDGSDLRRYSPFESFPNAEMNDTDPFNLFNPSAKLRPTPPGVSVVFALYVAPFNCKKKRDLFI